MDRLTNNLFGRWLFAVPQRAELWGWLMIAALVYVVYGTVVKPATVDFNIYRLAGYAYWEGVSPYQESTTLVELAKKYQLSPISFTYPYPPVFSQVMALLVLLPYVAQRAVSILFSSALLFASIWMVASKINARGPTHLALSIVLVYLPVLNCIATGQVSLLLLASLSALIFLSERHSLKRSLFSRSEMVIGTILSITFIIKPVLWPLLIWLIFKRRFGTLVVVGLSALVIVGFSIGLSGITPWLEYLQILGTIGSPHPYVENQSLIGFLARLGAVQVAQYIAPIFSAALIGIWFLKFRHLPVLFDLSALAVLAIFSSPVAWYHYFVLTIPLFIYFVGYVSRAPNDRQTAVIVPLAYALIQLHGILWWRAANNFITSNLAFLGLVLLVGIIFYHAVVLEKAERAQMVEN